MTTATELMNKKSTEYFESIKRRCNQKVWDENFENYNFVAQCFDDIQAEVMRDVHGEDFYNPGTWADDVENDYDKTCDIRCEFTNMAYEYVKETKEEAKPDEWD